MSGQPNTTNQTLFEPTAGKLILKKFSWVGLSSKHCTAGYNIDHNPDTASYTIPPQCQIHENLNKTFWSNCAKTALAFYLLSIADNDLVQAEYFKTHFHRSMTNRRIMKHLRIVDFSNYQPLVELFQTITSVLSNRLIEQHGFPIFEPLFAPINTWAKHFGLAQIDSSKPLAKSLETCDLIRDSIVLSLEKGLHNQSPTDSARILVQAINQGICTKSPRTETDHQIYKKLHLLNKFLSPYLLDVRFFKKKHRLDAILH